MKLTEVAHSDEAGAPLLSPIAMRDGGAPSLADRGQ